MTFFFFLLFHFICAFSKTILNGAGSGTFSYLITDWIYTYQILKPDVEISFQFTTEADARQNLADENISFVGLDSVDPGIPTPADFVYFPIVAEALVPQINLPTIHTTSIVLGRETLAKIFTGEITNWQDPEITNLNSAHTDHFPNQTITVVYRSDDNLLNELWSGALSTFSESWTYGNFTVWPFNLTNRSNWEGADGNLGVSSKIIDTPYSIGYVSQSYLAKEPQSTQYAQLVNAYGSIVSPFPENVEAAIEVATITDSLQANLINSPDPNAWPIASFLYFLVKPQAQDCLKERELFKFFFWILESSDNKTIADGFCPLSIIQAVSDDVQNRLNLAECNGLLLARYEPQNDMSSNSFVALRVVAGIIFAFCICLNAYHIYTYRTPMISLVYSTVFLIGSVLTLLSPFFWLTVPSLPYVCQGRLWLTSMGLCIILGTMFSRTWQLREIYKLTKGNTITHLRKNLTLNNSMGKLARTLSAIFLANLAHLILWTSLDPYTSVLRPTDTLEFEAKWHCYSKFVYVWMGMQMISIFVILTWGLFVIYQTWSFHQKSMLRETRWVLLTLYNVVLNIAAILPLMALGGWDDDKQSLGLAVSLLFSAGGIILANLLPKVVSTYRHKKAAANSKSSLHHKASIDGSGHGLVKLDVSSRSQAGASPAPVVTTPVNKKPKKANTKKKLNADEADAKRNKESPTLMGMELNRPLPREVSPDTERQEDSLLAQEPSVSSRATDFRPNDSFILTEQERPASPSNRLRIPFDDLELPSGKTSGDDGKRHPTEPTIMEEEEPIVRESTPVKKLRKLQQEVSQSQTSSQPSPQAAVSIIRSQVSSEKEPLSATPYTPPMGSESVKRKNSVDHDENLEVY